MRKIVLNASFRDKQIDETGGTGPYIRLRIALSSTGQHIMAASPQATVQKLKVLQAEIDHWGCLIRHNRNSIDDAARLVLSSLLFPVRDDCMEN